MSELNFNSIYDGVSMALHNAFPDRHVHGGSVAQGLVLGDFNVVMPSAAQTREVGHRFKRSLVVDVIYYPKDGNTDCYDMAHQLSGVLQSIQTPQGDIIHATSCEWEASGGVLHMLLEYDHFIYVPQEEALMDHLHIEQEG